MQAGIIDPEHYATMVTLLRTIPLGTNVKRTTEYSTVIVLVDIMFTVGSDGRPLDREPLSTAIRL